MLRLGYHAPLPPARTGVADYAQALLDALRAAGAVIDADAPLQLYQLGNNQLHRAIYDRAMRNPGVVLLHDANLHHFYLGALDEEEYVAEFCRQYGHFQRDFARHLWKMRGRSASDESYFHHAMIGSVARAAKAVLVHNPAAARIVKRHHRESAVHVIPHLFAAGALPGEGEVIELRRSLKLASTDFVLGVFGHLRESKRLHTIVRAFHRAQRREPGLRLLVAGEFVSAEYERALRPDLQTPGIIFRGYQPERAFWTQALMVDACVNLRYPSCGETSGIAIRLMGLGKPVLVTDAGEYSAHPAGSFVPIGSGLSECEELEEWMVLIAQRREWTRNVGSAARAHIMRNHSPAAVVERLRQALESVG